MEKRCWTIWKHVGEWDDVIEGPDAGIANGPGQEVVPADQLRGAVAAARADQREATIRHAAEWLRTLGRDDMATALVRALSVTGGR